MATKTYSIFGAGAAGLYTAWRLLNGKAKNEVAQAKQLTKGDTLELFDWGRYAFTDNDGGTREPGARVCTWHYKDDPNNSYLEVGGMRYSYWGGEDLGPKSGGHRLVTTVINKLGLDQYSVPFNESTNPLYYLRTKNMYLNQITSNNPAPYNVDHYGASDSPDTGFNTVERLAVTAGSGPKTRAEWCDFYSNGVIKVDMPDTSAFKKGDKLSDIGYWNLMYDQLGPEGFSYTADGNGYTSNVINWNSAVAFQANNEFTPGTEYRTLTKGYSYMFTALFKAIVDLAAEKGIKFNYQPNTRLHSILQVGDKVRYTTATRDNPNKKNGTFFTDAAWMAMSRYPVELVAQATRYEDVEGVDVLNTSKVQLYLEAAVLQSSYKVGMFFHEPWWADNSTNPPPYPAQINSYEVTKDVITALGKEGFPQAYLTIMENDTSIMEVPFASTVAFIKAVESSIKHRLTVTEEQQLLGAAERNTIGPSVTDTPIRQVVYFGNNALVQGEKKIYGLLAAYDDEMYTTFWRELELGSDKTRRVPTAEDYQTLQGPREPSEAMIKMLRAQLAAVHFGPASDYTMVPKPLETRYMDWSLPPFAAGYHAWAAHYDVCDVQQKIRKPSSLNPGQDANIFIVGEAYSNDQAWVEGAYCTAESVLNDFFGIEPLISPVNYPFICPCSKA